MSTRLKVDGLIRKLAEPVDGPSCGNDTAWPMPTVAALSGGINV